MTTARTPLPIEAPPPRRRAHVLGTFVFRDFRLLWIGLLISNLGTWMQFTALGYYVVKLAATPALASLYVGVLGACNAAPALLLSPIAGVVADHYPRRRVLFVTQLDHLGRRSGARHLGNRASSRALGIFLISSIRSATQSFDSPARQSWVPLLVPREHVGTAIGLNSVAFNAPSVLGPPLAGFLILSSGVAASFYVNAIATLAVVVALAFMTPAPPSVAKSDDVLSAIVAGMRFLWQHPVLRSVVLMLIVTCLLVRPHSQLLPAYAAHVISVDARGLGVLLRRDRFGRDRRLARHGADRQPAARTGVVRGRRGDVGRNCDFGARARLCGRDRGARLDRPLGAELCRKFQRAFADALARRHARALDLRVLDDILGLVPLGSLLLGSLASLVSLSTALVAGGVVALALGTWVFAGNAALRRV